jgi:hypothetical protein
MDKTSKQIIQGLMNELALERQLADQLAEALIERRHGSTIPSPDIPRDHTQRLHVPRRQGRQLTRVETEEAQTVRSSVNEMATTRQRQQRLLDRV